MGEAADAWRVVKGAVKDFSEDKALRLAAALAYYGVFALVPFLFALVVLAGFLVGEGAARDQVLQAVADVAGSGVAQGVGDVLARASAPGAGLFGVFGVLFFVLAAAGAFVQLQDALDTVWEVRPVQRKGWRKFLQKAKKRLMGALVVVLVALLVAASLLASTVLAALERMAPELVGGQALAWRLLDVVVSLLVLGLGFAVVYKVLPDVRLRWSDVAFGAGLAALLFVVGKFAVAWYVGRSATISAFGAAAFVVVVLLWLYYSAIVVLFGAEVTQAWARVRGRPVVPDEDAVPVTAEARARQGMPAPRE